MYAALINANELTTLYNADDVIILDASAGPSAHANYLDKHLPGAIFLDLNTDLAAIRKDAAEGGRHPLPPAEVFAKMLGEKGISPQHRLIVYDDKAGANAAARLWWMLRSVGHEKVQVLNGGIQAAEKEGIPTEHGSPGTRVKASYSATGWQWPQVNMNEVADRRQDQQYRIIDVRDAYRYNGDSEPIDLVAGHIPGAINVPYSYNLDENGLFLDAKQLREKYEQYLSGIPSANVILHCGSGVTACHSILAMSHAGMEIPALYVGSWSEWSRNEQPIGRAEK